MLPVASSSNVNIIMDFKLFVEKIVMSWKGFTISMVSEKFYDMIEHDRAVVSKPDIVFLVSL